MRSTPCASTTRVQLASTSTVRRSVMYAHMPRACCAKASAKLSPPARARCCERECKPRGGSRREKQQKNWAGGEQRTRVHLHVRSVVQVLPLAHAPRALHAAGLLQHLALRAGKVRAVVQGRGLRRHGLGLRQHIVAVRRVPRGRGSLGLGRAAPALGVAPALARRQGLETRHRDKKGEVIAGLLGGCGYRLLHQKVNCPSMFGSPCSAAVPVAPPGVCQSGAQCDAAPALAGDK